MIRGSLVLVTVCNVVALPFLFRYVRHPASHHHSAGRGIALSVDVAGPADCTRQLEQAERLLARLSAAVRRHADLPTAHASASSDPALSERMSRALRESLPRSLDDVTVDCRARVCRFGSKSGGPKIELDRRLPVRIVRQATRDGDLFVELPPIEGLDGRMAVALMLVAAKRGGDLQPCANLAGAQEGAVFAIDTGADRPQPIAVLEPSHGEASAPFSRCLVAALEDRYERFMTMKRSEELVVVALAQSDLTGP